MNLVRDAAGRPALVVGALRDGDATTFNWGVLAWRDSAWVDSIWSAQEIGGGPPQIVPGAGGGLSLLAVSRHADPNGYNRLSLWSVGAGVSPPETVAVTTSQLGSTAYSAALTSGRRWVARVEQPPNGTYQVHTYYSDSPGVWHAVGLQGSEEYECAITALGDTTALLVYSDLSRARWSQLQGTQWTPAQPFPRLAEYQRFAPRPSGGWWLVSADGLNVQVDRWAGTGWEHEQTLESLRDYGESPGSVYWLERSVETAARPAIAWYEYWEGASGGHTTAHVAWPTDSGWTAGYRVADSDDMDYGPTVAVDRNSDVWLTWNLHNSAIHKWTHSYVSATTGAPRVRSAGTALSIAWTLSERAPDSWWAVLRDPGTGVFQEVARVRAGSDTIMSWLDASPPIPASNPVRYRIRRESVDARFAWQSAATTWGTVGVPGQEPGAQGLRLAAGRNPVGARATLELLGAAAGPVQILVYDVSGRLVSGTRLTVGSTGAREVALDLGRQSNGIYLVIARDAHGRSTTGLKLVRLEN